MTRPTTWIALLRGINVGGRNTLPMATVRTQLESAGFGQVQTCIQSGNCIFESGRIGTVLYLHAPEGIGRSRLAAQAERKLGVTTTARNLRTAKKLLELAQP